MNWFTSSSNDSVVLDCFFIVVAEFVEIESFDVVDMDVAIVGSILSSLDIVVSLSTMVEGAVFDVVGGIILSV